VSLTAEQQEIKDEFVQGLWPPCYGRSAKLIV